MVEDWNNGCRIPGLSFLNPTFQYSIIPTFQLVIAPLSKIYIGTFTLNSVKAGCSHAAC